MKDVDHQHTVRFLYAGGGQIIVDSVDDHLRHCVGRVGIGNISYSIV